MAGNSTPSPALAADAIERLIAKADAQVAWAGSVFRAKEVAEAVAQLTALQQAVADAQKDTGRVTIIPRASAEGCCAVCFEPITLNREMLDDVRKIRLWRTCACDNAPMIFRPSDETMAWLKADAARTPDPATGGKDHE